jgi:enterochelin esterase family protein
VLATGCRNEHVPGLGGLDQRLRDEPNQVERERLVDAFWGHVSQIGTPLIENDTTVTFLYRGPGQRVRVMGDMTGWQADVELERIASTDLFAGSAVLPADARIEYKLLVDDNPPTVDPMCKYGVLGGFGVGSEVAMPRYVYHPLLIPLRDGSRGGYERVMPYVLPPRGLGYEKQIHVYTPLGYEEDEEEYPTVYFLDGTDYIEFAQAPRLLDGLIETGAIRPIVAVFASPPNPGSLEASSRSTEYHMNPHFADWMAGELVPFVEAHYRVSSEAGERMVIGASSAGLAAAYIPFHRPDAFGIGYSQSGYVTFKSDTLLGLYAGAETIPIRLFVDVGIYETGVGKGLVPDEESNLLAGNRRFRDVLESKGYDFVYREYPEGHTYGNWRRHLIDALEHFFPARSH